MKFWRDMGATRVILARELSLKQIKAIKKAVPEIEVEIFVHGSQCMSYSGRCLLSDYMTKGERKANHGGCVQSCRWSYKLLEETRPGEYYEIVQDERGSHILSPKDLCLVRYIDELMDIGVDSFKAEGRTKSLYYVSAVAKAYRAVMDGKISTDEAFLELKKVGNRGFTEGFFMGNNDSSSYSYEISKGLAGADFLCIFLDKKENLYKVVIKNKMLLNDEFEIITPNFKSTVRVKSIYNDKEGDVDVANTNDEVWMELTDDDHWQNEWQWALGRTVGIKNETQA